MKTKEELTALKTEVEELSKKLSELSREELEQVVGGSDLDIRKDLYENIILGAPPEEHNVMLSDL